MSDLDDYGTVVICRGPDMHEVHREKNGEPRWCFQCRKRVDFDFVVESPSREDMEATHGFYGPQPHIECRPKRHLDGDVGFGQVREWDL